MVVDGGKSGGGCDILKANTKVHENETSVVFYIHATPISLLTEVLNVVSVEEMHDLTWLFRLPLKNQPSY